MAYTQNDKVDQVYILASIWIEVLFYGFYACLFIAAIYIISQKRASRNKSSMIFFGAIILMFLNATLHVGINLYRLLRAYGFVVVGTQPIDYFHSINLWDNYAHAVMWGIMTWIGDALVIYRCWVVWNRNWFVIALPLLLLLVTVAVSIMLYVWFGAQFTTFDKIMPWVDISYPLAFVQNILTTGLIAFKIWKQYRDSKASGLVDTSPLSLINIMRIIVESAALYTLELFIIIFLYFKGHPSQFVVQSAIIPTVGMVFVLIAIRVELARQRSLVKSASSVIPPWLSDDPVFRNEADGGGVSVLSGENHPLQIITPGKPPRLVNRSSDAALNSSSKRAIGV